MQRFDDYTPWSFVVPMTVAVALGVLIADGIKLLIVAFLAGAVIASFNGKPVGASASYRAARSPAVSVGKAAPIVERLDGPITARARSISRACIAGHVADRSGNGWSDDMRTGTPLRCTAISP